MLKLVKLSKKYKKQLFDMIDEWTKSGEKIVPWSIRKNDYRDFENYLNNLDVKKAKDGLVFDSTFFALDISRNIFVGVINIRNNLNDKLLLYGGHIGDGIRPSERRKGYATEMISLALVECKKLGMDKVLMVCYKDNIGSKKSIIKNGGILENEIIDKEGKVNLRYWLEI